MKLDSFVKIFSTGVQLPPLPQNCVYILRDIIYSYKINLYIKNMEANFTNFPIEDMATGSIQMNPEMFSQMDIGSFFLGMAVLYVFWAAIIIWSLVWKLIAFWRSARDDGKLWYILFIFIHTLGVLEIIYIYFISPNSKYQKKKKARLAAQMQAQNVQQYNTPDQQI